MAFDLLSFLTKILGGFGIAGLEQQVLDALKVVKAEFPDSASQVDALTAKLTDILAPYLDPTTALATIKGIALDIIAGTGGEDPDAWQGSV